MIRAALDLILQALEAAGIRATIDSRNLQAPGCFVTVTHIGDMTLDGEHAKVTGAVVAVVRDLGGTADIDNLTVLVDDVVDALVAAGVEIKDIDTNEQATPPTGGKLPAAKFTYSLYL